MSECEQQVEAAQKDDKEGQRPCRMHLHRVAELDLQSRLDDEEEGAIVEQPCVDEEYEAEQIQLRRCAVQESVEKVNEVSLAFVIAGCRKRRLTDWMSSFLSKYMV